MSSVAPSIPSVRTPALPWLATAAVLALVLHWSYWQTITQLLAFWQRNPDYSVGALVLPTALWLGWSRRHDLRNMSLQPAWLAGSLALLAAQALRIFGLYYGFDSIERYALVGTLVSGVLLLAGWSLTWRVRWLLVFLVLLVPFPQQLHDRIALPLQSLATGASAFALETCGFYVARTGNVLQIEDTATVAVAEACSGLRMLTAFIYVTAVLAFWLPRPTWQKVGLLLFTLPLAVLTNAIRVFATALFVYYAESRFAEGQFHDLAGLAMMPVALLLTFGLLRFFDLLAGRSATAGAPA